MHAEPLLCDLETYSEIPLKYGTHKYAEGAEVMLWAWAFGDEPVQVWDVTSGEPMPDRLREGLLDPERMVVGHNWGMFDNTVLKHAMPEFHLPIERVHDTMVRALCHGLPGGLGPLCEIMRVPEDIAKGDGKKLIQLFCKPMPKNSVLRRATRATHPKQWAEFVSYAGHDISAMRYLYKNMPIWNYRGAELELWHLDQRINNRGIMVDKQLAQAAIDAVARKQAELKDRTQEITSGELGSTSQRGKLLKYLLAQHGVSLPDMRASTLERRVQDTSLPWALRELLAIRLQVSATSTSKYKTLLNALSLDDRIRGLLQFCGASRTARWAGRTFQPQNLPSRNLIDSKRMEGGIKALLNGTAHESFDDIMKLTASTIRSCLIASPGKKLVVSDLANIEGRDAAWIAEEEWKLQAFRDFDAGTGPDLYALAYAKAFGVTPEAVMQNKKEGGNWRQIGKVMELALAYGGGVGAFITFALVYGIDLDEMAEGAFPNIPGRIIMEARNGWEYAVKKKRTYDLNQTTWMVCDSFKRLWRRAHPEMSSYWTQLEEAVRCAVNNPGKAYQAKKLKVIRTGAWLRIVLPSGRAICYASPRIANGTITYLGLNTYTRKWGRQKTYGGSLFENVCQAVARDVMAHNMVNAEICGYNIVLTVHDELVTEAPDTDDFSAGDLSLLLANNPPWCYDMPLSADGYEAKRYKKG